MAKSASLFGLRLLIDRNTGFWRERSGFELPVVQFFLQSSLPYFSTNAFINNKNPSLFFTVKCSLRILSVNKGVACVRPH